MRFGLLLFAVSFCLSAAAAPLAIPIPRYARSGGSDFRDVHPPASDLIFQGKLIDAENAFALVKRGVDISALDPEGSDVWTSNSAPISVDREAFPADDGVVKYQSLLTLPDRFSGMFRAAVTGTNFRGEAQEYNMMVSLDLHGALLRAALLRRLGYPVEMPRYYKTLKVQVSSEAERERFLLLLSGKLIIDYHRWVKEISADGLTITLKDLVLEKGRVLVPQFHWGLVDSRTFRGHRALRALILPLTFGDTGESINKFGAEAGRYFSHQLNLNQIYADTFVETAFEDARWSARRLAKLAREDFNEIVKAGAFPDDVAAVVVEKLISRRNSLVEMLWLGKEFSALPHNLKINIGQVKDGRVTQEFYEGYGARFAHGDGDSPFKLGEMLRFGKMQVITKVLEKGIEMINRKVPAETINDVVNGHQEKLFEEFYKHLQTHPDQPFAIPVGMWGGPIADFSVNARRDLISGTYYGVDSKVQLVDSVGVRLNIGAFFGTDGFEKIAPSLLASAAYQRTYLHIRPVNSIKAADKTSWKNLMVPKFMADITKNLKPDATPEEMAKALDAFLEDLKDGEVFTIVESLSIGAAGQLNIPILQLLGLDPGVASSIGIGAGVSNVNMRKINFRRTSKGLQVFVQQIHFADLDRNFSFKYFIDIFRTGVTNRYGDAATEYYDIPLAKEDTLRKQQAGVVVNGIFRSGSADLVKSFFKGYELDHKAKEKIKRTSLLFHKWDKLEETHIVKVRPPAENGIDPKSYERTLGSYRMIRRSGNDFFNFVSDIVDGFAPGWGPGTSTPGGDPGATMFGNSKWVGTRVESEITEGRKGEPMAFVESTWTGWNLSRKKLFKIFDDLEERVRAFQPGRTLVNKDEFLLTDSLQLYEVKGTTVVYQRGYKRVREHLIDGVSEVDSYNRMIALLGGEKEFGEWCRWIRKTTNSGIEIYYTEKNEAVCAQPWMKEILGLRKKRDKVLSDMDAMKQMAKVFDLLHSNVQAHRWLSLVGEDGFFFAVRVAGFRKHDERGIRTEDGQPVDYVSNSVGTYDPKAANGIFSEFVSKYGIMGFEMNAQYFSDGF